MYGHQDLHWKDSRLYLGSCATGNSITPDTKYPSMWRVRYPDGSLSDIVNLTRARDGARAGPLYLRRPVHSGRRLCRRADRLGNDVRHDAQTPGVRGLFRPTPGAAGRGSRQSTRRCADAGAAAAGMSGEIPRAAIALFDAWKHDLAGLLARCESGRRLQRIGLDADIAFCAQVDRVPVVAELDAGGVFRGRRSR